MRCSCCPTEDFGVIIFGLSSGHSEKVSSPPRAAEIRARPDFFFFGASSLLLRARSQFTQMLSRVTRSKNIKESQIQKTASAIFYDLNYDSFTCTVNWKLMCRQIVSRIISPSSCPVFLSLGGRFFVNFRSFGSSIASLRRWETLRCVVAVCTSCNLCDGRFHRVQTDV